ncbi:FAD-dependent oxidoreductase, partial [Escherichia coli]|nr:FAD-dependent oxidoreductase [Escherichia coli]
MAGWIAQRRAQESAVADADVVIVGAGIVGVACAAYLAEAGRSVTVIDRTGVCEETSAGNAAAFAFSDVLPLAQKGMLKKLPRWLMDPLGPLAIRPSYLPTLTPWLLRFLKAGNDGSGARAIAAQAGLMKLAEAEWMGLMDRSGTRSMLREDGSLELYESEAEFRDGLPGWKLREQYGIGYEHVEGARLGDLQPGLSPRFVKGTFVPGWKTVSDPKDLGKAIWAYAESKGARLQRGLVRAAEAVDGGAKIVLDDGQSLAAGAVLICAGAWSHLLAAGLGEKIPLDTERGYNTTLPS